MPESTASNTAADWPERVGSWFGHYRLRRLLGRGGFGEVYEAEDTRMDRVVALKLIAPAYSGNSVFRQRLYREARTAGRLHEPHVVPIHHCGEIDGQLYIDMRMIEGTDLQTVLARGGPLEPARSVAILRQIASALDAAHAAQVIHRDVKPANVLLTGDDFACLVDFGIANAATDAKLTTTGTTIGTFAYMAPERLGTAEVDHRADIYALGCVLYECLTGSPPYPTGDLPALITAHLSAPIPRPSHQRPQIPAGFDDVIARSMAKKPHDRYVSAGELATAAHCALTAPDQDYADTILASTQADRLLDRDQAPSRVKPPPTGSPIETQRKNRTAIAGLVATVAALVIVGALVLFNVGWHGDSSARTTSGAPPPNSGPFTGTYTADFGPDTDLDGKPRDGATPTTETWATRSVCRSTDCVATTSRMSGTTSLPTLVFDHVGERWVAVGAVSGSCQNFPDEEFYVITLQPQPDGRLAGEFIIESTQGCADKSTVTFTRTGNVDIANLPDPGVAAPRVVSPAESLHGQYHSEAVYVSGPARQEHDFSVHTYCLRTGDRCMSYFYDSTGDNSSSEPLVFQDETWTRTDEYDSSCPKGGTTHIKQNAKFPLPQPPQDPITRLTGHGFQEESGSSCISSDYDENFVRTGD
ncbi:putative transmembrane serine/threonine-protein kinase H PknH (protein kinase H) (STPK H) [Mycobacterium tuberculosis H37Rv] [Mycobacterium shimoidei]|uniref:non-specific serine/threonine protein kinase n=1 Tax=Mycobacterium shimoidei TaxID=29313 RepID=A0A375YTR8_MYCSH|nr:putative transmembrane serine/threonine-protein kinase H PknH (protein kinase H) (STPK H) [Mycobacterium tuberculosis H37Rv] [Mycobacterium shimoidei]